MLSSHCLPFIIFVVVVGGGGTEIQYLQISFNIFGGGGKEKQSMLMNFKNLGAQSLKIIF